jgi:hydrogenase expression/formation protein HypE
MLKEGKVPHELLSQICRYTGYRRNSIVHGPFPGFDVGTLDLKGVIEDIQYFYDTDSVPYMTYKSDPITFPTSNPARSLIIVNQNDLATSGSRGYVMTITMLFPLETEEELVLDFQKCLDKVAKNEEITILGGHSEVTSAVEKVVLSGSFIGFVPPEFYIGKDARAGDKIIFSGWIGAEGTGIILEEGRDKIEKYLNDKEIRKGRTIGSDISISNRVLAVNKLYHEEISMVHDITEGGFRAAIYESLNPLNLGAKIEKEALPVTDVSKKICKLLDIDPFSLIGSGAVIIYSKPESAHNIVLELQKFDKPAKIVGEVKDSSGIYFDDEQVYSKQTDTIVKALRNIEKID